jgi:hypothetical protein
MQDLEVPDFRSVAEFNTWAKAQKPAFIRQWVTEDWLQVYDELDCLVAQDAELAQKAQEKGCSKTKAFLEEAVSGLGHLYQNYCFEEEHFNTICEKATEVGTELAENEDNYFFDPAMLVTELNQDDHLRQAIVQGVGEKVSQIVHEMSELKECEENVATKVDDTLDGVGVCQVKDQCIVVNSKEVRDEAVMTWFHEAAHAYLQVRSQQQRELWMDDKVALSELGNDFHELMLENNKYYLDSDLVANLQKETSVKRQSGFSMYSRQPVEKYSELFGIMAERAYRRESGYYSERGVMKIAKELRRDLGAPQEARYDDDYCIVLRYGQTSKNAQNSTEDILKYRFSRLDENSKRQLNLHAVEGDCVEITIPTEPYEVTALMKQMIPWQAEGSKAFPVKAGQNVAAEAKWSLVLGQQRLEHRVELKEKFQEAKRKNAVKNAKEVQNKTSGR